MCYITAVWKINSLDPISLKNADRFIRTATTFLNHEWLDQLIDNYDHKTKIYFLYH